MPKRDIWCLLPVLNIFESSRVLTDMNDFIILAELGSWARRWKRNGWDFLLTLLKGLSQLGCDAVAIAGIADHKRVRHRPGVFAPHESVRWPDYIPGVIILSRV